MAESQVPYPYLPDQIAALRAALSEPRFGKYLSLAGNDEGYALALYLYNARVAKSFIFPLGVVEVTLRNAIDAMLVRRFGQTWHQFPAFVDHVLTPEGRSTLQKAIDRAKAGAARGQVVAELTFDFWSNLFRPDYGDLWRANLGTVLPNLSRRTVTGPGMSRHDVQTKVRAVNAFRNRIAHHEPILDMDINAIYATIVELVSLRCEETAAWLRHHSTVSTVVRTRPKSAEAGFVALRTRLSPDFIPVRLDTALDQVLDQFGRKFQAAVCVDDSDAPIAVFGALELVQYVAADAAANAGLTAPSERTVGDLLTTIGVSQQWVALDDTKPFSVAVDHLRTQNVQAVIGLDTAGRVTGVILRAHRRY